MPQKAGSAGLLECELARGIAARRRGCGRGVTEITYPSPPVSVEKFLVFNGIRIGLRSNCLILLEIAAEI